MAKTTMIDLTGEKYDRLTVLWLSEERKSGVITWVCKCACGKIVNRQTRVLRRSKNQSCGCLKSERLETHGLIKSRIYRIWATMIQRCKNPKTISYKYYGGKGIRVCEDWLIFENFYLDMGDPPSGEHSIDRIDGSKYYCRENCRWETDDVQSRNRKGFGKSSYKGVAVNGGTFVSRIVVGGKSVYLGSFALEKEAALAYNRASEKYFGKDGYQNKTQSDGR